MLHQAHFFAPSTQTRISVLALLTGALLTLGAPSQSIAGQPSKDKQAAIEQGISEIRTAIDEKRFFDAEALLDQAAIDGVKDDRLPVLSGDLDLAKGQPAEAYRHFFIVAKKSASNPAEARPEARVGEALALSLEGKSDEAFALLKLVVKEQPSAWKAWNALGVEYDQRKMWDEAEAAYASALSITPQSGLVLNNRGYSRLLQGRLDAAQADFVASLDARPDLVEARANLRITLALKGDFEHATLGASAQEKAAILNNAGFAATAKGDYVHATALLQEAMKAQSTYYEKADANLKLVKLLQTQLPASASPAPSQP